MDEGLSGQELISEEIEPDRNPYSPYGGQTTITANAFFFSTPLYNPILVANLTSDCRDHCANERTYLSWIRISLTLALVSCAVYSKLRVPRHIKHDSTDEIDNQAMSDLLDSSEFSVLISGIFLFLSLMSLFIGLHTYVNTLCGYAFRKTFVHNGRSVRWGVWGIALSILATNIYVLLL